MERLAFRFQRASFIMWRAPERHWRPTPTTQRTLSLALESGVRCQWLVIFSLPDDPLVVGEDVGRHSRTRRGSRWYELMVVDYSLRSFVWRWRLNATVVSKHMMFTAFQHQTMGTKLRLIFCLAASHGLADSRRVGTPSSSSRVTVGDLLRPKGEDEEGHGLSLSGR